MGITGKYNFPGIQRAGAATIRAALASTGWGAALLGSPFAGIPNFFINFFINWAANQGLIILNIAADWGNGEIDQAALDQALDKGLAAVELGRGNITPAQGKAIDDAVILAARKFITFKPRN